MNQSTQWSEQASQEGVQLSSTYRSSDSSSVEFGSEILVLFAIFVCKEQTLLTLSWGDGCWKFRCLSINVGNIKTVTPICLSRFPPHFPDGNADAVLCFQSQPTESKKGKFWASANPNTSESVSVCSHKTPRCLFVHTESIRVWEAGQVSKRAERKPATRGKNLIWEQRMKCGTRGQERAFWWASIQYLPLW